jgi:hypothetical protein
MGKLVGRLGRLLIVVTLMLAVFMPAVAFAQTDYPTVPTTTQCSPTPCTSPEVVTTAPQQTGAATAVRAQSTGGLAFTGGNIALLVGLGLLAAFVGALLVRFGRRARVSH